MKLYNNIDKERLMASRGSRPKVKWTEQMNRDLLECKKKAKELLVSENPPCKENGNKKRLYSSNDGAVGRERI